MSGRIFVLYHDRTDCTHALRVEQIKFFDVLGEVWIRAKLPAKLAPPKAKRRRAGKKR